MEKINWKPYLKKIMIDLADEFYLIFCSIFVAAIIFHFQPEKSMQVFTWICDFKDFGISIIFLSGIAIWAFFLRFIITGIFKIIMFLFRILLKTNK